MGSVFLSVLQDWAKVTPKIKMNDVQLKKYKTLVSDLEFQFI
jgi:hypothetical protein